jgi:hypothetical protein
MMGIAIRTAARPGRRRLVYLCAALAGLAAGLVIGLGARAVPGWIPADARAVTVAPVFDFGPLASHESPDRTFTVTDQATVAEIAAVIDGLSQLPSGTSSCPAYSVTGSWIMLTAMQLTFKTAPGGPVVASVTATYVGCAFVGVTVGARTVAPLDNETSFGQPVQQQILAIAGIGWPAVSADTGGAHGPIIRSRYRCAAARRCLPSRP